MMEYSFPQATRSVKWEKGKKEKGNLAISEKGKYEI